MLDGEIITLAEWASLLTGERGPPSTKAKAMGGASLTIGTMCQLKLDTKDMCASSYSTAESRSDGLARILGWTEEGSTARLADRR